MNGRNAVKVMLINSAGLLLLQLRNSSVKNVVNKGVLTCFGGLIEAGETKEMAAIREIREETGLILEASTLSFVGSYEMKSRPATTYVFAATNVDFSSVNAVSEGAGFMIADYPDLATSKMPISPDAQAYLSDYFTPNNPSN